MGVWPTLLLQKMEFEVVGSNLLTLTLTLTLTPTLTTAIPSP